MTLTLALPLTAKMAGVVDRLARARQAPYYALTPAQAKAAYEKGCLLYTSDAADE